MPELPEVETIRRDLVKKILNKKIVQVVVYRAKSVAGENTKFVRHLRNNSIIAIERRGKLMVWRLQKKPDLLVHLKMTGQLIYERKIKNRVDIIAGGHKLSEQDIDALPNKFTRVAVVFANGGELFFNDLRVFGYMKLADEKVIQKALAEFGLEPLTKAFTMDYFEELFKRRSRAPVKALLLDQQAIAGLGNIYADEVLFCADVKPSRPASSLSQHERKKIFTCIPKITVEALKHRGTTFRNFLDSSGKKGNYTDFLKVYDRDGEACKRCGTIIKKIRCAGRGTHFCPYCQK